MLLVDTVKGELVDDEALKAAMLFIRASTLGNTYWLIHCNM